MNKCLLPVIFFLVACSPNESMEEKGFRETLVDSLTPLCGEDESCVSALRNQSAGCMMSSGWRQFFKNKDKPEEIRRFTEAFYACIVDEDGKPYFGSNFDQDSQGE